MQVISLVLREIAHRPLSFLVGVVWVAVAVAACLSMSAIHEAANRETKRLQRDIGFNLRIIPAESDKYQFLDEGYTNATMPEDAVQRLAKHKDIIYNHLVGTLRGEYEVEGTKVLITGLAETVFPPGHKKKAMSPVIELGTAHVGKLVAEQLKIEKNEELTLGSRAYKVVRIAPQSGTRDDLRVWLNIADAQELLDKPGQINEIQAIDCLCLDPADDPQSKLQTAVEDAVPEAQVVMLEKIATARARQRQMMERLAATVVPIVVVTSAFGLAALAWLNVRSRTAEIGVLHVLGHSRAAIAALVLGRALLWGIIGSALGIAIAMAFTDWGMQQWFPQTGAKQKWELQQFITAMFAATIIACISAAVAATMATVQDPARVLRED